MTTNLERIRQMNSEELARLLSCECQYCSYKHLGVLCEGDCETGIIQWLEQESEE